jgi:hypothetical protein
MKVRSSILALIPSLAVALAAYGGNTIDVGSTTSQPSEVKYMGGCTPAKCANQDVASVSVPGQPAPCLGGTLEKTCERDPLAGTGSLPVGSCRLTLVCSSPDAGH